MAKSRSQTLLTVAVAVVGLFLVGIPALRMYMRTTATVLHPKPQEAPSAPDPLSSPDWTQAVERGRRIVRERLAAENLPGLSVAVGVDGQIVWAEGFGFADLDTRAPVTPKHRFRIGTASVVLTSAAAGLLLEQGRLKLDEPIRTYVPAFPEKQWPVTLRDLMGHMSGVRNDGGDEGPLFAEHCARPVEALPHFANRDLLFEPGTRYHYSSYGWILVSAAIEAGAGTPFVRFMQERVFDPLGLRDTVAESANEPVPNTVTFYFPRFAADPKYGLHDMRKLDYSCYSGASVFLSTPSDLVRFGMGVNRDKLLRRETVELLQKPQRLTSGEETGYGLGWDVETVTVAGRATRVVGHDGDVLGGKMASLVTLPEHGIVVAAASNISYADTFTLAVKLAEAFIGSGSKPGHP